MKLFSWLIRANAARQVLQDPTRAGREAIWGVIQGYMFVIGFWIALPLIVTALLGFGPVLGGPYQFFEILFYILLVFFVLIVGSAYVAYIRLRDHWRELRDDYRKSQATDVEIVEAIESE